MKTWYQALLVLFCLLFSQLSSAQKQNQPDIITMNNGEIFHGTVAQEHFTLNLKYGQVTIPYNEMYRLITGDDMHHIESRHGDKLTGLLQHEDLMMMRLLAPTLPLASDEISTIDFGLNTPLSSIEQFQDRLELTNGDQMLGQIISGELMIRGEQGISLQQREQISTVDILSTEGEPPQVLLRLNKSEQIITGTLMNSVIELKSPYGQSLSIPPSLIERLSYNHASRQQNREGLSASARQYLRDRLVDGTPGPEMVILPAGEFQRGDLQGDGDFDEQPAALVSLPRPFAIALHEVTFKEYDHFCESTRRDKPEDEGWGRGQRPVVNVNWNDAVAYTQWLSRLTGKHYRLPTDAEWEYAARSGNKNRYWWGNEPGLARANCTGCGSLWDGEQSAPVGRFAPNPFGLYDVTGNVWEWVADCFHDKFAEAPADGSAVEKQGCGKRVIRGGAWSFPIREMRSANRWRDFPSRSSDDTGFRVVREIE